MEKVKSYLKSFTNNKNLKKTIDLNNEIIYDKIFMMDI